MFLRGRVPTNFHDLTFAPKFAAMASLKGRAEVSHVAHLPNGSAFHVVTASDSSRVSHDTPSTAWLAHGLPASTTPDADERPPKRRKVDADCSLLPTALDDDKSIILAKVSLDLVGVHIASSSSTELTFSPGLSHTRAS